MICTLDGFEDLLKLFRVIYTAIHNSKAIFCVFLSLVRPGFFLIETSSKNDFSPPTFFTFFLLLLNKKTKKSNEPEKLLSQDNMFSNNVKTMCVLLCPTRILARYQTYHVTYLA